MEDIAFSDWPGQPLDLSGSNPWLPAYGFQPPSTLLDKDDFLGNPDAHLFLNGTAGQHYVYLETIQEETSDDLRSESDVSESRTSPVGWLATDSESGSVIRIENIEDIDSGSEREIACPSKRRRQENLLNISDDESNQSLSRSSSLIQFESLEKQCQDVSSSSPNIFSAFSFDSLENQRKNDELERRNYMEVERGSDYYKTFKIDVPSKATRQLSSDSLLYNATRFSGSDSSESSEDTLDATKYNTSVNNLKTWKSFDGLHVNNNVLKASSKVSVENLSEDSGYGDNFCQFAKLKSSSIPNIAMSSQNVKAEKPSRKRPSDYLEKYRLKNCNGFEAYDGEIFQNFTTNFGASYQDLSIFDRYEKIDGGFVRNSSAAAAARRRNKSDLFTIFRADVLNIEKASECVRASKFNVQTTSEPNLLRAISYSTSVGGDTTTVTNSLFDQVGYFGNCVYVSSVPKDLNLAENINIWNAASCFVTGGDAAPSIAAKNWDLIDLSDATTQNQSMSTSKVSVKSLKKKKKNAAAAVKKQESPLASSESDTDVSFKREGSYLEAMANMIDMSDDEFNPCYRDKTKRSTILEFDKIVLKAISETSIQSLGTSRDKMDMLFTSTPIFSQNRNVKSTPNLAIFNNKNEDEDGEPQNKQQRNSLSELPRKSSLISRSRSTSRISSEVEEKQTATTPTKSLNGSTSSKGVHFCPVVAEVNWQVRDSIDRDSQSLSSTPDLTPKRQSPPPPPIMRPEPRLPEKRAYVSQPDLQTGGEVEEEIDKFAFVLLKPRQSISQPNVMIHRRRSDIREDPDGSLVTNYMDTDGVTYKHTHIGDVYKSTPTTTGRHVPGTSKQKEVKAEKPVPAMEPVASHRASKSSSKTGKLGGFFSRIASFKFPSRKSGGEDKGNKHNKKKSLEASKNKDNAIAGQRLATKEDYIYIPLKGPPVGPCNNNEAVDNNKSVLQVDGRADENACLSAKPPLPKLPPRVVGASVKKRPEAIAQLPAPERRTIDSGDALPRPMEPMGLIETDLDTEVTVITSGAHVKTRSLMNLGAEAPPRSLAAPPHPSRPHKSMEFLLDKQNLKVVEPPENELQKGERIMSEHELRIQRSLQKLTVPDWYKQAEVPREGFILKKPAACRESRWSGTTGSKTTSLSSLGSNSQSPVVLSPTPQNQPFVRWSTSKLNSTASSPCASTRSSFNARQPNGSISPSSLRSSFNYRQPYLGWRSQERLTRPRTPAERLANTLINQSQQQESPEIQTSIKEVTSAIVHYVSGLKPEDGGGRDHSYDSQETASQRSMSVSPRGSQKLCWLESSFVGTRPLDSPQTPVTLTESQTSSPAPPSSLRLDLHTHNDFNLLGSGDTARPSPGSTTLEDVLDSLLGLPSSTRAPSPSLQETVSANTSPVRENDTPLAEQFRRRSEGSEPATRPASSASRRVSFHSSPVLRCRYSRCGRVAVATSPEGLAFKNCHNCSYTYCSRACRRAHWEKHRKTCLFSRVGSLCRQVIASCKEKAETLHHLSVIARRGYLSHGLGAVKCFFSTPEAAEKFLVEGLESLSEPTYICWKDLLPSEMGPQLYTELVKMCKNYNPDSKLILYVSVCVISEAPAAGAVKWERQLVSRCAKMRLSKDVYIPERDTETPETLILTSQPIKEEEEAPQRLREISFNNIQRHLRQRGVSLRRHYPEVYQQLSKFVEGNSESFKAVTVYPRDMVTGKTFMCIIMPESEPENLEKVVKAGVRVRTVDVLKEED